MRLPSKIARGLDIYHGDTPIDWQAVKKAGIVYCWAKATQGDKEVDPAYLKNYKVAHEFYIISGGYHFYVPGVDPIAQAHHFLSVCKPQRGDMLPVLDIETAGKNVAQDAFACAMEIKKAIGKAPIIYSGDSFFQTYLKVVFSQFTKWIARYGREPVTDYTFWQNSDTAHLPGTPHQLDIDTFKGDVEALNAYRL